MAVRLAKQKPKWLSKIAEQNREEANKQFAGRCKFVVSYLEFVETIEEINSEFGTNFSIEDIFEITQEDEQRALDMIEGEDDDD